MLPAINPQRFARILRSESVVVAGCIKHPLIDRLKNRTRNLPVNHYKLMHHIDEDIRQLSEDSAITSVLRHYLKSEPVLLEATLSVTEGANASSQNTFHFDYAGWESVNVFVYLTNVSRQSAHHTVIKGSHLDIRLRDIFRGVLSHGDADIRFGARITPIIGEAGTLFFENTEAFHCRHLAPERRVLLNLLYASHKSCLSRGRTSKQHIKRRAAEYRRFVNSLATRPS
ncbi:hypothetical protein [Marinimicrobium sp. ARAG 43.8]|uniref:hypothetical protein n=1 Tax=Marinimicrobium sp. ARAG 43.8 TaxID=3418719 RepID=UPI003CEBC9D5